MIFVRIFLFSIAAINAIFAFRALIKYLLFRNPDSLDFTGGFLTEAKHKKNAPVYGTVGRGGPIVITDRIKHLTRTKYRYNVKNKSYIAKGEHYGRRRESARIAKIVYNKRFPFVSYVEDNEPFFGIWTFVYFSLATVFAICGIITYSSLPIFFN
jgi:hypothetical protein